MLSNSCRQRLYTKKETLLNVWEMYGAIQMCGWNTQSKIDLLRGDENTHMGDKI
jgi:hypothetical protein